jgi:hypothetical protein
LFARAVRRALADIRLRRDLSALKRAGQLMSPASGC